MEGYKTGAIFGLIGLVALLLFTTGYFATAYQTQKDETAKVKKAAIVVKLNNKSEKEQVARFFKEKIKFPEKAQDNTVWVIQGKKVYEEDIFSTYGLTTQKQKNEFTNAMFKAGNKRFIQTCNQVYGAGEVWSLAYCTLEPFPKEGVA